MPQPQPRSPRSPCTGVASEIALPPRCLPPGNLRDVNPSRSGPAGVNATQSRDRHPPFPRRRSCPLATVASYTFTCGWVVSGGRGGEMGGIGVLAELGLQLTERALTRPLPRPNRSSQPHWLSPDPRLNASGSEGQLFRPSRTFSTGPSLVKDHRSRVAPFPAYPPTPIPTRPRPQKNDRLFVCACAGGDSVPPGTTLSYNGSSSREAMLQVSARGVRRGVRHER